MNNDPLRNIEFMFAQSFRGWKDSNGEKHPRWIIDSELEASIRRWSTSYLEINEENFARSCLNDLNNHLAFLSLWLGLNMKSLTLETNTSIQMIFILVSVILNSLATKHLSAFLKRIGYDAAKKVCHKLRSQQNNTRKLPPYDSIDQVFQFAWLTAINPPNFFRNFDAQFPSLLNYAKSTMKGIVNDKVFGKKYPNITVSRYSLLRELKPRARKKALQRQGYWEPMQSCYALAWECLYQIYTPRRHYSSGYQHQTEPTQRQWEAIANQYNKLRHSLPKEVANQIIDWRTIKEWIDNNCIPAVQMYLDPPSISIDIGNQETSAPVIELPDISPTPDLALQQEEMNEIIQSFQKEFNLKNWLEAANLEAEKKLIMLMRYGLKLTQSEVAVEFGWYEPRNNKPAYTRVLRREDQVRLKLAIEVGKWAKQYTPKLNRKEGEQTEWSEIEPEITFSSEMLDQMGIKEAIVELLHNDYQTLVQSFFDEALLTIDFQRRKCLQLRYVEQRDVTAITTLMQLSLLEVNSILIDSQQNLQNSIVNQIQTCFNVTFQPNEAAVKKIAFLVESLLKTATYM